MSVSVSVSIAGVLFHAALLVRDLKFSDRKGIVAPSFFLFIFGVFFAIVLIIIAAVVIFIVVFLI